ncbi:MAG: hypothetical protein ABIW31_01850, partial [Novosphingobium sp.]
SGGHPAREAKPLFRWNPATTARVWNNPTAAYGPAYRDLDQAMRDLGALWGLTESATRYFKKPESFFWQLTETRGVKIAQKGLDTDADAAAIRDWLRDQGMTARGDETPILIGDLVDSALCDGFGVIQRADGRMCDVLHIGRSSVGDLGEPKGSMQVRRGVSLPADVSIWTPR